MITLKELDEGVVLLDAATKEPWYRAGISGFGTKLIGRLGCISAGLKPSQDSAAIVWLRNKGASLIAAAKKCDDLEKRLEVQLEGRNRALDKWSNAVDRLSKLMDLYIQLKEEVEQLKAEAETCDKVCDHHTICGGHGTGVKPE